MDMDVQLLLAGGVVVLVNISLNIFINYIFNRSIKKELKYFIKNYKLIRAFSESENIGDWPKKPIEESIESEISTGLKICTPNDIIGTKHISDEDKRSNWRLKMWRIKMTPDKLKFAVENLKKGMHKKEVCEKLNLSYSCLYKWVTTKGELTKDGKDIMKYWDK